MKYNARYISAVNDVIKRFFFYETINALDINIFIREVKIRK